MLGIGSELAKARAEGLRADGGYRSAKSPGRLRTSVGYAFVGAGQRLLGHRRDTRTVRLGGGA
jgi:hypothetical protein